MDEGHYEKALICLNGHMVNNRAETSSESNEDFCSRCGVKTIMVCPSCDAVIRGAYHTRWDPTDEGSYQKNPAYCHNCGKPYPWTAKSLVAAQELADEFECLTPEERAQLKNSLSDLVKDSPRKTSAANRVKKLMKKVGKEGVDAMKSILYGILSAEIRINLFGS